MSQKPIINSQMPLGEESVGRVMVEQLERIAIALERIVEDRHKPPPDRRNTHRSPGEDDNDRILSFWGP